LRACAHLSARPYLALLPRAAEASSSSDSATKPAVQSQSTFATLVKAGDGWTCRVLKQTIQVGTRSFELQEIYGIDQSAGTSDAAKADDLDDEGGRECVICMTDPRDTTVLPCRHMCMCNKCAKVLRLQSNKCPICRCAVESLLQIKVKGADKPEQPPAAPAGSAATEQVAN
jgi:E3 ubiquitin-protein ligase MGRN1